MTRTNRPFLLRLKNSHRRLLKKPFGRLASNSTVLAAARKTPFTVSVGDATTLFLLSNSLVPSIGVVDFLEKRFPTSAQKREKIASAGWGEVFLAANAPGTLSSGALLAVKQATSYALKNKQCVSSVKQAPPGKRTGEHGAGKIGAAGGHALVIVQGEEDLLFLAAVLHAPKGALLLYGQPGKGIVMLQAGVEAKKRAEKLLGEAFE